MVRARLLTIAAFATALTLIALIPASAQAARTPQVRALFVKDAQYCLALGMRPRVQIDLSAPGKVMFSVWSIKTDLADLEMPKQTAGPRTVTLPQGTSVLEFPVAFGRSARDFKPTQANIVIAQPYNGFNIGMPKIDMIGFMRLPACG
ncbi:MAG: hypothetical protein JHC95_16100 [Solirubrobacteraceae bacterium]|nr:hypothetical protein [Solirubrobacteraceae bacterium]